MSIQLHRTPSFMDLCARCGHPRTKHGVYSQTILMDKNGYVTASSEDTSGCVADGRDGHTGVLMCACRDFVE